MTRSLALLLPLMLAPTGCIIYENNGDQNFADGDWWDDEGDTDPGALADAYRFGWQLYPPSAAPGDTLLVTLDTESGRDLLAVTALDFGASITLHDLWIDEVEILAVIEVAADAAPGPQDVVITLADGSEVTIDAEFVVEEHAPDGGGDTGGCN